VPDANIAFVQEIEASRCRSSTTSTAPVEIATGPRRPALQQRPDRAAGNDRTVKLVDGKPVSFAKIFATQVWVAAAVMRLLGWSVKVPLKVYRRTGDDSRERLRPADHPLARAIIEPWDRGRRRPRHGDARAAARARQRPRRDRAGRRQRDPLRAVRLPRRDADQGLREVHLGLDDRRGRPGAHRPADTMLHLAWWSPLGPLGVSPLQQLGVTLSIEDAAQRYQRSMFKNGARPPSAITADEEFLGLDPRSASRCSRSCARTSGHLRGPDNAGKPALLPPGLDWKPVGHTAVEAALIEQRKVAREEVCAVYQIPPPFLGILDRATFNNIQTLREVAYTDGLGPPLVMIEQTINAQLVRALLREDDVFVEFDFAGVLRGDRLKEMQALREAIGIGLMTRNEGRSVLNMPQSDQDGMDDFYFEANNMGRVGDAERDHSTDPGGDRRDGTGERPNRDRPDRPTRAEA
jgi:hypothetical protein